MQTTARRPAFPSPVAPAAHATEGLLAALDRRLVWPRVRLVAWAFLAVSALALSLSLAGGDFPFDRSGHPIAADLPSHLSGGRIMLEGDAARLYDPTRQATAQLRALGADAREPIGLLFLLPPAMAVVLAPLAALPYAGAAAVLTGLSLAAVALALWLLWPLVPRLHPLGPGRIALVAVASYPGVENILAGQFGGFWLLIAVAGLRLLVAGRYASAGAVLGLGVLKPQLLLGVPILFIARRQWRALTAWCAVAGALALGSLALVGPAGARDYVALLTSDVYADSIAGGLAWKMLSLPALARAVLPASLIGPVLALTSLAAAAVLLHRAPGLPVPAAYGLALLLGALANPHLFAYDGLVLVVPALILFDAAGDRRAVRLALAAGWVLSWTAPLRQAAFGALPAPLTLLAAPWAALAILVLAVLSLRARSTASGPEACPVA